MDSSKTPCPFRACHDTKMAAAGTRPTREPLTLMFRLTVGMMFLRNRTKQTAGQYLNARMILVLRIPGNGASYTR